MHARLSGRFEAFAAELRRRRVPQTALWYAGSAVAVVEAANAFLPSLGAPAGAMRFLVILAVFGFPVAVTLSWVYDVSSTTSRRWTPTVAVALVAGVSLIGAFAVWQHNPAADNGSSASFKTDPAHLAVLGFETAGNDADLAAFAANLQTRLIDGLSVASSIAAPDSKRLRVVSRASILPFSKPGVPLDSIRRTLGVGTLLDGAVERTSDGVRVSVRLVDAQSGDQIMSFDTTATDKVAVLDAVAAPVLDMIRKRVGEVVRSRMSLLATNNREAFDKFVLGTQQADLFAPAYKRHDLAAATSALERADSLFALAEKSDKHWIEPIIERGKLSNKRVMLARAENGDLGAVYKTGIRHAERALKLFPDNYDALSLRGEMRANMAESAPPADSLALAALVNDAQNDLEASLIGNPTPARSLRVLSELAGRSGRLDEALDYGKRAYKEDPYLEQAASTVFRIFEYSFALGRDAEAARYCGEGRSRFHDAIFDDCRLSLAAWSDTYPIKPDSAWLLVHSELAEYPTPLRTLIEPRLDVMAAAVLARNKMPDSARAVVQRARLRDASAGLIRATAGVYELLGMKDSANVSVRQLITGRVSDRQGMSTAPELRLLRARHAF